MLVIITVILTFRLAFQTNSDVSGEKFNVNLRIMSVLFIWEAMQISFKSLHFNDTLKTDVFLLILSPDNLYIDVNIIVNLLLY